MKEIVQTPVAGTREALLAATLEVLHEEGIEGATARAITARAGVNLQAIVYHFGSKDALVSEALRVGLRRWLQPALDVLQRDMEPFARMRLAIKELQGAFARAQDDVPVYLEALARAKRDPATAAVIQEIFAEIHGLVAGQIRELKRKRVIPRWVDPDAMASLQIAAADGLAIHSVVHPGSFDPGVIGRQAAHLLFAARRRRGGKADPP